MVKRVPFTVPDAPPKSLLALSSKSAHRFTESLKFAMFNYFISFDRPQTATLPREILRRTVEGEIISLCHMMMEFPVFNLSRDRKKFIRCCYSNVWQKLLREWKARLLCALGKKPREIKFPRGSDPWLDLPE